MSTTRISRLGFKAAENGRFDIMKSIYRKVPHQVRAYMTDPVTNRRNNLQIVRELRKPISSHT